MTTYVVRSWAEGDERTTTEMEYFGSLQAARTYIEEIKAEGYSGELLMLLDEFQGEEQDSDYYFDPCAYNGVRPGIDCPVFV